MWSNIFDPPQYIPQLNVSKRVWKPVPTSALSTMPKLLVLTLGRSVPNRWAPPDLLEIGSKGTRKLMQCWYICHVLLRINLATCCCLTDSNQLSKRPHHDGLLPFVLVLTKAGCKLWWSPAAAANQFPQLWPSVKVKGISILQGWKPPNIAAINCGPKKHLNPKMQYLITEIYNLSSFRNFWSTNESHGKTSLELQILARCLSTPWSKQNLAESPWLRDSPIKSPWNWLSS